VVRFLQGGKVLVVLCVLTAALAGSASAQSVPGLQLGMTDELLVRPDDALRNQWFDKTKVAGANLVLLTATWSDIAPSKRPGSWNPRDPGNSHYKWGTLDAAVKAARGRSLNVMILVTQAPKWAEDAHRPHGALPGTWKVSPKAYADFAHAIAQRYSGGFHPDGLLNPPLPRVQYWQAWAEANLTGRFAPQSVNHRLVGANAYRTLLNGFYGEVKGVHSDNLVVTSGLAPYGDHGSHNHDRTPPVLFWRSLLCLKGAALIPISCNNPAHFDIAAHNPINSSAPTKHAKSPTDVTTPDLGRITRVINKARQTGRVVPNSAKPLWATEFWWESKPPKRGAVSLQTQAHWLEQALYLFWKQGASAAIWYLIRDQDPDSNHRSYKTGLFFQNGKPKPAYTAYKFPFVATRHGGNVGLWGEAPGAGTVTIQRKQGGGWQTLKTAVAGSNRVFTTGASLGGSADLRATQGGQQSLTWHVGG
jgi:hypothetical protein